MKTFTVRIGTIRSIFDMLRYDQCWPASEEDANKLALVSSGIVSSGRMPTNEDHVVRFTTRMRTAPTVERWASFGCEVLER